MEFWKRFTFSLLLAVSGLRDRSMKRIESEEAESSSTVTTRDVVTRPSLISSLAKILAKTLVKTLAKTLTLTLMKNLISTFTAVESITTKRRRDRHTMSSSLSP